MGEITVTKLTDRSGTTFNDTNGDTFEFGDEVAKGGTSIDSVTDMVIDPFNPSAAFGDGSVVFVSDPIVLHDAQPLPVLIVIADGHY